MVERFDGCMVEFIPREIETRAPDDFPACVLVLGVVDFFGKLVVGFYLLQKVNS